MQEESGGEGRRGEDEGERERGEREAVLKQQY